MCLCGEKKSLFIAWEGVSQLNCRSALIPKQFHMALLKLKGAEAGAALPVMTSKPSCFPKAFACCCCALRSSALEGVESRSLGRWEVGGCHSHFLSVSAFHLDSRGCCATAEPTHPRVSSLSPCKARPCPGSAGASGKLPFFLSP